MQNLLSLVQLEDLGAWIPNLTGEKDFAWVIDIVNRTVAGVDAFEGAWATREPADDSGGSAFSALRKCPCPSLR